MREAEELLQQLNLTSLIAISFGHLIDWSTHWLIGSLIPSSLSLIVTKNRKSWLRLHKFQCSVLYWFHSHWNEMDDAVVTVNQRRLLFLPERKRINHCGPPPLSFSLSLSLSFKLLYFISFLFGFVLCFGLVFMLWAHSLLKHVELSATKDQMAIKHWETNELECFIASDQL